MPKTFDEAAKETESIFAAGADLNENENSEMQNGDEEMAPVDGESQAAADAESVGAQEAQGGDAELSTVIDEDRKVLDNAVGTAEAAAQELSRTSAELSQIRAQNAQLEEQLREMSERMQQMSQQTEENIVNEALKMPTLDINGLAFADEDTVRAAQEEYAKNMADYIRGGIMHELEPYVKEAKEGKMRAARDRAFDGLSHSTLPQLDGIAEMRPQLDRIISANSALSSDNIDDEERYIMAYMIAKGVNAANTPKEEPREMTPEEFLEQYKNNEEYRKLIEQDRVNSVKQSQQVPQFSASSGAVNAALNIPDKPKTWDEASERTRRAFR